MSNNLFFFKSQEKCFSPRIVTVAGTGWQLVLQAMDVFHFSDYSGDVSLQYQWRLAQLWSDKLLVYARIVEYLDSYNGAPAWKNSHSDRARFLVWRVIDTGQSINDPICKLHQKLNLHLNNMF